MNTNVFLIGARCWSTSKTVPWTPDAIHILLLLAVIEVVPPYSSHHITSHHWSENLDGAKFSVRFQLVGQCKILRVVLCPESQF